MDDSYCDVKMVDPAIGEVVASGWIADVSNPRMWVAKGQWLFFDETECFQSVHPSEDEANVAYREYVKHMGNTCAFCGAPTERDRSEQVQPADYCHPEDHML